MEYSSVITPQLFTLHWTWIGWIIALIFTALLFTRLWRYIWKLAFFYNAIGWLCTAYAGLTGDWFTGWFAWVIYLSTALFIRFMLNVFFFEANKS